MLKAKIPREEKVKLYAKLVAFIPGVKLKGDTMPYTSLNGHIVGNDTTTMRFDSFDLEEKEEWGTEGAINININYEHNKNLKGKHFVEGLHEVMAEAVKRLSKTRR